MTPRQQHIAALSDGLLTVLQRTPFIPLRKRSMNVIDIKRARYISEACTTETARIGAV